MNGHTAIISGGAGDIGRAIALELARRGANIAIGDIVEPEKANDLLEAVLQMGQQARYDRVDVTDAAAVRNWVQSVEDNIGIADLIIPNAAIVHLADIKTITPEEWSRELSINLTGAFHLAQAGALRLLHHERPGRIVFIGSWAGHAPRADIPTYCVTKAGIRMLGRCMARDLAPHGILVNEVAPGNVDAGLSGRFFKEHPELREKSMAEIPVGKLIEADEVAWQVAHLCEPQNQHMPGSVVLMDGGLSLLS